MKSLIAFLGPEGTFAHLVAQQRFRQDDHLVPMPTIREVLDFVCKDSERVGIVPIENSSGGTIYDTVDRLIDRNYGLVIQESLSIDVQLALLGKDKRHINIIYSHFAPLYHCEDWLREHYPAAKLMAESSTATAVKRSAEEPGAAAIGNRSAGEKYHLKVLEFPIKGSVPNVTQFFVLGHKFSPIEEASRTTIVATLPNKPGALVDFLEPFKDQCVNLTRIMSRPVSGKPETYLFMVDIAGTERDKGVKSALDQAKGVTTSIRNIGAYPVRPTYKS
ncbi:MAG: ACT domain-containing protein [Nitrospirae bacterium]|nr:ACT domain-containing protein [Candidatus Troglogloeales bacterium]MBI3598562.1 ACT domain-containing protein [Candidatus Troglogloeales bacterium]